MLHVRNAHYFRRYYKEIEARNNDRTVDVNFISTFHPDPTRKEKGFSNLVYGSRKNIGGFLRASTLNVAADQQAIYELIQNADDCNSSFFSVNCNEKYLLCINNGDYFSNSNMASIINVGESDKQGEDIGTFGIGFKILHRLLGEDDGLKAIMDNYAGPIMFSWNKYVQFENFLKGESIRIGGYDKDLKRYNADLDIDNPWLVKIVYTCFPTYLDEEIRLADFETKGVVFSQEDLEEMRTFLRLSLSSFNLSDNYLKTGSIFFIKLGAGKFKFINENIENLISGISYSFNFLNKLRKIYINGKEIKKKTVEIFESQYERNSDVFSQINPRNNERDIKFKFAFYADYKRSEQIIGSPNFYNFFSMDEEKNNFRFLLHCNAFDMNNDRRKLQPDSQINERLLPVIANEVIRFIDGTKETNVALFRNLFALLLLSQEPINKPNINKHFFNILKNYYKSNIPIQFGFSNEPEKIKIKGTMLEIQPSDLGCKEIAWFDFQEGSDDTVIEESKLKDKLGLKKWDIVDLMIFSIEKGQIEILNKWIQNINESQFLDSEEKDWAYMHFLSELNEHVTETSLKKISLVKLFKFSDGLYHSIKEIFENPDLILISERLHNIKTELRNIGLITSFLDISKFPNLNKIITSKISELKLFQIISEKTKTNKLKHDQKRNLFLILKSFETVDISRLSKLELFCDTNNNIKAIESLLKPNLDVPTWLTQFKISKADYFSELDDMLIDSDSLFLKIIYKEWDHIIEHPSIKIQTIKYFYQNVISFYNLQQTSVLLNDKNFIYNDNKFLPQSEVFYHNTFAEISLYDILRGSIKKLTGFETASKDILQFVQQKPFSIKNDSLKEHIHQAVLSQHEALTIFNFAEKAEVDLFSYGYFSDCENSQIVFRTDKAVTQYYTGSEEIIEFIGKNLSNEFKLLPKTLLEFRTKVCRNLDLQEAILEALKDNLNDYSASLIDILTGVNLYKLYKVVSEFKLKVKDKYVKEDFEFKLLANLPEDLIEGFNSKLIISTSKKEFISTEITNTDTFKIDGKKLILSKILTKHELTDNAKIVSDMVHQLSNIGIPKTKLEKIFGIEKNIDITWYRDKLDLLLNAENSILKNSEQLAFILLFHKFIENIDLSKIKIQRADGEEDKLNYTWYSQNISFIDKIGVLGSQYLDINKHFELSPDNPFYNIDDSTRILYSPYFDNEEIKFVCDYLKKSLNDEEKIDLVDFIFNYWTVSQANKRLIANIDWNKINGTKVESVLGFIPYESIWDDCISLDSEQCPEWLKNWGQNEEKQMFLSDFGINMYSSPICQLRKSFYSSTSFPLKELANNTFLKQPLLKNTLLWVVEKQITITDEGHYKLLCLIGKEAGIEFEEEYDFASLINCCEWSADYYGKWKESSDCEIRIYLNECQMPLLISYDKFVVWKETRGDYTYNIDTKSLYINSKALRLENILLNVALDPTISFTQDHLTQLFLAKNNSNNLIAADEYERIKTENEFLKNQLQSVDQSRYIDEVGYLKKGGLTPEEQKAISLETRRMTKQLLLRIKEFDCIDWNPEEDTAIIQKKVRKNGELIDIVVVSAKTTPIHLSPFAFNVLASNPNNQLFVRDAQGIHNVTFNDIFADNQYVNMIFDTNYVPHTVLAQLAHVFNYVTNTKFVIQNPHFSANSLLLGFGLENRNAGNVAIVSTDEDW